MDKRCRGVACIINVFFALGQTPRYGTDVDRDRLTKLFEQLHFRVVVFNDEDNLQAEVNYYLPVNLSYKCLSQYFALSEDLQAYNSVKQNHSMSDNFRVETAKKLYINFFFILAMTRCLF